MWFPETCDGRTRADQPDCPCGWGISLKLPVVSTTICCLAMVADIDAGEQPGGPLSPPADSGQVRQVADIEQFESDAPIRSNVIANYKGGFILETIGEDETPFQLKVNGRMQGRYTGFVGGESGQVGTLFRLQYQVAF